MSEFAKEIDRDVTMRSEINRAIGKDSDKTVAPLLLRLYKNAEANTSKPKQGHRYDMVIRNFAVSLYIIMGTSGYEMLRCNLGNSLPHVSVAQRILAKGKKIKEGQFFFDELKQHLEKWNAPPFVHLHLDDTRIIDKVEYDPVTDRLVGFCLPVQNGLPKCESFVFTTFDQIKDALKNEVKGKYAHVIVAKPINPSAPAFIIFMMCTDATYNHDTILSRWGYVESELKKRGVGVVTNGADGAGPFLKAMTSKTFLFSRAVGNVPPEWTFFLMPKLSKSGMCSQDMVHLLAKFRTRVLMPSNIIVMGNEVACRGQFQELLKSFAKSKHGLTKQIIENKDKQNYKSIEILLKDEVTEALEEINSRMQTKGTITYLWTMRNIRDAFFDRGISPLKRISLMWKSVFFLRIWRKWLHDNGYSASDHFVTQNVFVCTELNGHMLINTIYNVIEGVFPADALRVWNCGSQGCEQVFRLLRSMTPTFSTVVNFSMKGVLERAHKLNFLASVEASEDIIFPRAQRRLLQLKEETEETLKVPSLDEITECIQESKREAVKRAEALGMVLPSYNDKDLLFSDNNTFLTNAFDNDLEDDLTFTDLGDSSTSCDVRPNEEVVTIRDDISRIFLEKQKTSGIPTYVPVPKSSKESGRVFSLMRQKDTTKSAFVEYDGVYIRKTTALYILQENPQLSNDRLLRVRSAQPSHLFTGINDGARSGPQTTVYSGDLCIFQRIDTEKYLLGRVVQFSYMEGSKSERQYSSTYVDTTDEERLESIGVLANYYQAISATIDNSSVSFKPLITRYRIGYLSMRHYKYTVDENALQESDDFSFAISPDHFSVADHEWKDNLSFDYDFEDEV